MRDTLPVNFAAIAANGFFFATAGKVVAAGLLLTWFVSELTPAVFWVGLIVPIQYGLATLVYPPRNPFVSQFLLLNVMIRYGLPNCPGKKGTFAPSDRLPIGIQWN